MNTYAILTTKVFKNIAGVKRNQLFLERVKYYTKFFNGVN